MFILHSQRNTGLRKPETLRLSVLEGPAPSIQKQNSELGILQYLQSEPVGQFVIVIIQIRYLIIYYN